VQTSPTFIGNSRANAARLAAVELRSFETLWKLLFFLDKAGMEASLSGNGGKSAGSCLPQTLQALPKNAAEVIDNCADCVEYF
jgi:hypothetical protein